MIYYKIMKYVYSWKNDMAEYRYYYNGRSNTSLYIDFGSYRWEMDLIYICTDFLGEIKLKE